MNTNISVSDDFRHRRARTNQTVICVCPTYQMRYIMGFDHSESFLGPEHTGLALTLQASFLVYAFPWPRSRREQTLSLLRRNCGQNQTTTKTKSSRQRPPARTSSFHQHKRSPQDEMAGDVLLAQPTKRNPVWQCVLSIRK